MMQELFDALGYVGSSLDKLGPRPLRGLLAGHPRELASIVPFSDRIGLTDPNEIQYGRDVTNKMGLTAKGDTSLGAHGAGLLADVLIDPVGLAAGGYGAYKAIKHGAPPLGRAINKIPMEVGPGMPFMQHQAFPGAERAVNEAADWVGMRFPRQGGDDALRAALGHPDANPLRALKDAFQNVSSENYDRVLQDINPGAKFGGSGVEALGLTNPEGYFTTVRPTESPLAHGDVAMRPRIKASLMPLRSNDFGGITVEHMHHVTPLTSGIEDLDDRLGNLFPHLQNDPAAVTKWNVANKLLENTMEINEQIAHKLKRRITRDYPYLNPFDVHPGNVSITPGGKLTIHDAGAVLARNPEQAGIRGYPTAARPDEDMIRQVLAQNSPQRIQEILETLAFQGPGKQGVLPPEFVRVPVVGGQGLRQRVTDPLAARAENIKAIENFLNRYADLLEQPAPALNAGRLASDSGIHLVEPSWMRTSNLGRYPPGV
jgi:hypothetical protein